MISANGVTYDNLPKLMKQMCATKVAALGYGRSASSTAAAENLQKFAIPAVGLKAVNGVKMKSTVLATGYGQPLLDQPVSATFGPEVVCRPSSHLSS